MEKCTSISVGQLQFTDSLQFINNSLDKLVANLVELPRPIGKMMGNIHKRIRVGMAHPTQNDSIRWLVVDPALE